MKAHDYLLKMKVGQAVRTQKWNGREPLSLDHPVGWVLEPTETGFRLFDGTEKDEAVRKQSSVVVDGEAWLDQMHIDLPPTHYGPQNRNMSMDLQRLFPLRPAYSASLDPVASNKQRQLFVFYGLRYFMIHYRPVSSNYVARIGESKIFSYDRTPEGYQITPIKEAIKLKIPGERKRTLSVGQSYLIPDSTFFNCTFLSSVHWWRFQAVPTPDNLPPIETEETEDDEREAVRLQKAIHGFIISFALLTIVMVLFSKRAPKIIAQTQVELKQPKIIPLKEPPKLVEKKPEPQKKVAEKPPEPKKPEPKKLAKTPKPPKPKKVAQKAALPSPKPPTPTIAPPPTPKAALPPAAGLIAKKPPPAPPPPDPNKQLAQSLSFLGTSSSKPMAQVPTNYKDSSKKYDPKAVGGGSPNSQLNEMMNVSTDSTINTQSARTIAGNIKFGGKGGGKELNNVQGKVSSKDLYDPNAKFGTGFGARGLSISGAGTVNENEIENALAKFMSKFQYCYEKALLSHPDLGGNIVYRWTINTSGKAQNPKVLKTQMNDSQLQSCISNVLKEVPFPKPKGGTVEVTKTFTFSSATL